MTTLNETKQNNAKIAALKIIKNTQWTGETRHITIDKALIAINLFAGSNSGWYTPTAIRIKGVSGIFMVNEDGGLHFESRIIKENDSSYLIEHLTPTGYNNFEKKYLEEIHND